MPKSGMAGSWGRLIPNVLRNHHTDFQSSCTSLHSHQQWRSVPLTPHPLQHKLSLVFLILAILTGVRWYLRVVWICMSLIAKDLNISLSIFWPLEILLLRILCLAHCPIFKLGYLEFWCLISWVLYLFWRSVLCLMWGWWRSFPMQYAAFLSYCLCPLLTEVSHFHEVPVIFYCS